MGFEGKPALLLLGLFGLYAGCRSVPAAGYSEIALPSGTYSLAICRGSCESPDGGSPYIKGTLVLQAAEIPGDVVARADGFSIEHPRRDTKPTGCFTLAPSGRRNDSLADANRGGFGSPREDEAGSFHFPLFTGVDASYWVVLRVTHSGLAGYGISYYFDRRGREQASPRDEVIATRIGGPDLTQCPGPLPAEPRRHDEDPLDREE